MCFTINVTNPNNKFWLIFIILGIMGITLFPVWPIILKKGIFYLSLFLLILIVNIQKNYLILIYIYFF
jgi:hypothetical protein